MQEGTGEQPPCNQMPRKRQVAGPNPARGSKPRIWSNPVFPPNGNKRLALALGDVLLRSEGYKVAWELDETVKFMLRVARGEISQKEVVRWLRTRSRKLL